MSGGPLWSLLVLITMGGRSSLSDMLLEVVVDNRERENLVGTNEGRQLYVAGKGMGWAGSGLARVGSCIVTFSSRPRDWN